MLVDRGKTVNAGTAYLMSALPQVSYNLGQAIKSVEYISESAARVAHVSELMEIMDDIVSALCHVLTSESLHAAQCGPPVRTTPCADAGRLRLASRDRRRHRT